MKTTRIVAHIHVQLLILSYSNPQNSLREKCAKKNSTKTHKLKNVYLKPK